jgi:hypothetical protein
MLRVELLDQFRRLLKQGVGGEDPTEMNVCAETFRRLFQGVDNIGVSDGREVFRDIITRRAIAAQRAGNDYQIADF